MLTLAVALAVLVGTLAQSVSGIGFSLVSGPLLVAALGPVDGVRLSVALSLLLNVALVAGQRRDVALRPVLALLLPAALTTPLWIQGVRALPDDAAAATAALVVLLGVGLLARGVRWSAATGPAGAVGAGILAGGTNAAAAVAGPVVAIYAANAGWPAATTRASLQAFFLGLNVVSLPLLGLPRVGGPLLAACLLAQAAGLLLGGRLALRVGERAARRATLALAAGGAVAVLVRAAA